MARDVQIMRIYDAAVDSDGDGDALRAHGDVLEKLRERASIGRLTLLYAARDREHINAAVPAELVRDG